MSFPRYPAYKDSGVDWLGNVPSHWHVTPLKYMVEMRSGGTPDKANTTYWDGGIPWASAKDLKVSNLYDTADHISDEAVSSGASSLIPAGSVLVVVRGMILARTFPVVTAKVPMAINQDLKAVIPNAGLQPNFLAWMLRGAEAESLSRLDEAGHGTKALRMDAWGSMDLPCPPLDEQHAIAEFLDYETAKIDALVAEQEQLITLLKEKRQAVISHAVTKGLDPSVPMKDSGVEWLGAVPAHWEVTSLKRQWTATDCKHVTAEFVEDGIPLASIREVQSRWVELADAKRTTEHFYELLIEGGRDPRPGDLIFSRNATVGEVAQVPVDHPPFAMGQDVVLLRRIDPESPADFLQLVIRSTVVTEQLAVCMIGSTFKRINVEEIRSLVIAFPPTDEQQKISNYLIAQAEQFDHLIEEAVLSIELLRERRSALISAAVTGQIDVRGLAPALEQAA
ncbi:MAG: hypothetical protein A2711_10890 [Burkholderiales bacterium RIFCSPHIGHO2_01_FULL_63_240]|jgi:type I restriction enzyme, S subunit|nr:MAG: hypothetical protein A2711_10890 [Burkholderiales bacterium RIFCSPHIGHO2_01_FULL_63_240]